MNRYKIIVSVVLLLAVLSGCCTPKQQLDLGINTEPTYLPDDILIVDGIPQVVSASSESDGDVVIYYINTDGNLIGQVYGCYAYNVACTTYQKLGKQTFLTPGAE